MIFIVYFFHLLSGSLYFNIDMFLEWGGQSKFVTPCVNMFKHNFFYEYGGIILNKYTSMIGLTIRTVLYGTNPYFHFVFHCPDKSYTGPILCRIFKSI